MQLQNKPQGHSTSTPPGNPHAKITPSKVYSSQYRSVKHNIKKSGIGHQIFKERNLCNFNELSCIKTCVLDFVGVASTAKFLRRQRETMVTHRCLRKWKVLDQLRKHSHIITEGS
jgi:hypothetical protein